MSGKYRSVRFIAIAAAGLLLMGGTAARLLTARAAETTAAPDAKAAEPKVQRFGSVIGLKPEKKEEYDRLHAHTWPEILALLKKCHVRNYSIYQTELDGKLYLFSYFEYVGDDIDKDMAAMKADAKMQEWWKLTDPCQNRLPATPPGKQWLVVPEVFHMD